VYIHFLVDFDKIPRNVIYALNAT